MNVMEIIAPFGNMRLEDFPAFEDYKPLYHLYQWGRMTEKEQFDRYFKHRKRTIGQQCHCIKAFMKQHRSHNGHN